ncbi:hypothetical protein PG987_005966 [Apiospora arundinis]
MPNGLYYQPYGGLPGPALPRGLYSPPSQACHSRVGIPSQPINIWEREDPRRRRGHLRCLYHREEV